MRRWTMAAAVLAALAGAAATLGPARAAGNVFDYAASHPVPDARLRSQPTIGDSVPADVQLQTPEGGGPFGYFYFNGQPVIVDLGTRAVVRVGQ